MEKRFPGGTASAKGTAKWKQNDRGFHWRRFLPMATVLVTLLLIAERENGGGEKASDGIDAPNDPGTDIR
ncbi:MAG: hypothetical protein H8F28_01210 [Fibrella sp.]|nr:hypothetical protein [Armatimonadota bacterium]